MQFNNTPQRYGVVSAALHWLIAIAVYGMFALGLWMVTLSYYDGWYHQAPELHKSIGVVLMMGLVIRVVWRLISSSSCAGKLFPFHPHRGGTGSPRAIHIALFNCHQRVFDFHR